MIRTAFEGTVKGVVVEMGHLGCHMRISGSREVRFISYANLDSKGYRKPRKARVSKHVPKGQAVTVRASKGNGVKPVRVAPKPLGLRERVISDAERFRGMLDSIGQATGSK